ncbi:MAG: ABC transporter permease [Myxococcota bacterium]
MARSRLGLVALMARRLALRSRAPGPSVTKWILGAGVTTVAGVAAVLAGVSHPLAVVAVGAGGLALLIGIALRFFPAAMAVSVTGIALSCASLMTVLGVTTGFEEEIVHAIARLNGHVLLTKYGLDFREYDGIADRFLEDPRVTAASPFAFSMVAVVRVEEDDADPRGPAVVVGKGMDPRRAASMDGFVDTLERGSLDALRPGGTLVTPGLVLGDALAREVGVSVGDRVRVVVPAELDGSPDSIGKPPRYAEFELLDVLHTGTSEVDRNLALMHLTAAQALFFREGRVTGIELQLSDPRLASEMSAHVDATLGYPYRTSTWEQTNGAVLASLRQIRLALSLILGLMTLVSASSLLASLLLIVRRKRHDIGVLMAVGGESRLVFWVFESVGLLAGVAGSVLGLGLGALYCVVIAAYRYPLVGDVYPVDHLPVYVQPADALLPALAAITLCGLASGPVAVRASKTRLLAALGR